MNPLSLSYYTVPELDVLSTVDVAADTGCAHVGLRLLQGQPGRDQLPILENKALRREMRARLDARGVTVLDANTARLMPTTEVAAFRPFFEVAAELGARHALATGDDPEEDRLAEKFAGLADLAANHGMTVEIEFVPWQTISDVATAARLIERIGKANLGIAVDALHQDRSKGTLADIATVPPERFRYMHLCDAPAEWKADRESLLHVAVKERLFPGDGGIDLRRLLCALPAGIPLALEIPMERLAREVPARERVARAVAATRRLLAHLEELTP
jgi:sugar phosphate isomerase/epimerase